MKVYTIKDNEGRLWKLETEASEETVGFAIKFLKSLNEITIPKLEDLLLNYGHSVGLTIIEQPTVSFEL